MGEFIYKHHHPACKTHFDPVKGNTHILVSSIEELANILDSPFIEIAWDTETNSLSPEEGDIVGFSFSFDGKIGYYVPLKHLTGDNLPFEALTMFYNKLAKCSMTYVFNMRFDFRWLEKYGFDMYKVPYIDIAVGCWLADTNIKMPSLKKSEKHFLGWTPPTFEETIQKGLTFDFLDPKEAFTYACIDAEGTFALKDIAEQYMAEGRDEALINAGQKYSTAAEFENKSLYPLMKFEEETIKVDIPFLKDYVQTLNTEIENLEKSIYSIVGHEFNLNSNIQLGNVLKDMGINTGATTATGNMKVDINTLTTIYHQTNNKILDMIVRHSQLIKVANSYYQVLINEAERMGGVARFSYLTNNVPTGRLACLPDTELIKTDTGYKQLKDLDANIDKIDTGIGEFASFSILPMGIQELTKYSFKNGKSLVMTDNHRILTKTSKLGVSRWKYAKDLKKGDTICVPLQPHQLFKTSALGFLKGFFAQTALYESNTSQELKYTKETLYKVSNYARTLGHLVKLKDDKVYVPDIEVLSKFKNAEAPDGDKSKLAFWESYMLGIHYATPSDKILTFDDNTLNIIKKTLGYLKWPYIVERGLYKGKLVYKVALDNIDMHKYNCKLSKLTKRHLQSLYNSYAKAVLCNEFAQLYDYTTLTNIEPLNISQQVYDLSVEHPLHQYVSNGVISHNCAADKKNPYFTHLNVQSSPKPHSAKWYVHQGVSNNPRDVNVEGWYFSLTEKSDKVTDGYEDEGNFRNAFMAGEDEYWVSIDFCAQELRILANLSEEPNWVNTFLSGGDLHAAQAKAMWGEENYNPDKRKLAKTINFGLAYGMSAYSLAEKFEISLQEAEDTIKKYWEAAPQIQSFQKTKITEAIDKGTVYNVFSLPRRVRAYLDSKEKKGFGIRTVCNTLIQSAGSGILKFVFMRLWAGLFNRPEYKDYVRFQTTVHDEINYVVKKDHLKFVLDKIVDCMRVKLDRWPVPLEVEVEIGDRWGRCFAFNIDTMTPEYEEVKE